jgi:hypothetical protein
MSVQMDGAALPQLTEEKEDEELSRTLRNPEQDNVRFKVTYCIGYVYRQFRFIISIFF